MSTTQNQNTSNGEYAHPEALVSTDWIAQHLNDPNVRIIESNEDVLLYDTGHIPGARNYDGSSIEWGNMVGVPVEKPS